jgi:hypothetical protein
MITPLSRRATPLALALVLGAAAVADAHDTWLLPASMRVPVGRPVTLSLTSGMAFPADDFAINMTRLARGEVRLAGATTRLARPSHGDQSLRYRWTPARAGVATVVVELSPKTLTLAPHLVKEYLDEIDASPALRATWDRLPTPKQWRERYVKHAASFVRVGTACADTSWRTPMGLGLEIVPLADPTALRAGDSLPVLVLLEGKPHGRFAIGARPEGKGIAAFFTTNAAGQATVVLPTAGRWLLAGTDLRRTAVPGLEWESDFATVTLAVRDRSAAKDCLR